MPDNVDKYFQASSKKRLEREVKQRVQTTFIAALAIFEAHFADLLKDQESDIYKLYMKARSEILNRGNDQKRLVSEDLKKYEVELINHTQILILSKEHTDE